MHPAPLLFVSDLHLDAAAPDAIAQFMAFLEGEARQATALYILGDLFESWIGDDDDEPARSRVCEALRRFTRDGHPCFVMCGNRDFLLGTGFEARTGCRLLPDPVLLEWGAVRALVSHGDPLCTADHSYQEFRTLVRDVRWQHGYLSLPLATRRLLAAAARSGSRAHTTRTRPYIMDVAPAAVEAAFRVADTNLLIHGHTHRPDVHVLKLDGRERTRIVLGDWYDQGSVLRLRADGSHELHSLPRQAGSVNIESSSSRV
ncbi:MAG: UDP-2,3-diacylglucosamine diphosphatase [Pseudomonadota bacterium]